MTPNLIILTDPASPAAEAYRRLRVNLMSAAREQPLRTILIAAAGPDTDKARVVANLAVAFAKVGKQTILADCDLRHPAQHTLFGLANVTGVSTALAEEADVVLFDAPPVTLATDAAELAAQVDGVLLTVAAGKTKRDEAQRAKEQLAQVGARLLGAALVNVAADAELRKYLAAA